MVSVLKNLLKKASFQFQFAAVYWPYIIHELPRYKADSACQKDVPSVQLKRKAADSTKH